MLRKVVTWLFRRVMGRTHTSIWVHTYLAERGLTSLNVDRFNQLRGKDVRFTIIEAELDTARKKIQELEASNIILTRQKQNYVKDRVKKNG